MMERLADLVYRRLLAPLAQALLRALSPFLSGKLRSFVEGKRQRVFQLHLAEEELRKNRPLWLHASSGELEYARPVLRELNEKYPGIPLLVTYSSPSAIGILKNIPGISWGPVPWESGPDMRSFLSRFNPRCFLVARTDLWPVMIDEVRKAGLPSLMFSATFAKNSSRLKGFGRLLTRSSLRKLGHLQLVSEQDRANLGELAALVSIEIAGDTRFDQVFHRLSHPKPLVDGLRPHAGPVLVAGSTWPEDEGALIQACAKNPSWRMILAPHETDPAHLGGLRERLEKAGLGFRHYSDGGPWTERVLLIDRVGILAELYAWGDLAFVGGSFRKQVHSVMEPLAAGLRVLVGPFHHNNREALEFKSTVLAGAPLVTETPTAQSLSEELGRFAVPVGDKAEVKKLVARHQGATGKVMAWLQKSSCLE